MTADDGAAELTWTRVLASAREDADGPRTVRDLIRLCETAIALAGLTAFNSMGAPRRDAEALVFDTLLVRDHDARYLDATVTRAEREVILDRLERRIAGPTPVPYLTGDAYLDGRRFTVRPGVFVPRSTIGNLLGSLVERVEWGTPPRALELGCGTGALGISVARRVTDALVDMVDIDPLAVEVARENVNRHRVSARVRVLRGDMFEEVDPQARYDLVLANLPYVPGDHVHNEEISAEPPGAIFRPGDGLDLVRVAIEESARYLTPRGVLALEVGVPNESRVREELGERGEWWTVEGRPVGLVLLTRDDLKG